MKEERLLASIVGSHDAVPAENVWLMDSHGCDSVLWQYGLTVVGTKASPVMKQRGVLVPDSDSLVSIVSASTSFCEHCCLASMSALELC